MKIRSITYFFNPGWPPVESRIKATGAFLSTAKLAFNAAGYDVQTLRVAMPSFSRTLDNLRETLPYAEAVEALLPQIGAEYASLGPALPDVPGSYEVIPEALANTQHIFFSGVMADSRNGITLSSVRACAEVIVRAAGITPDGFANLRFAALANVPPGAPFFPAAYHEGSTPAFALATEAADLAIQAFENNKSLTTAQQALTGLIEHHGKRMSVVGEDLARLSGVVFGGIDFSLAPYPTDDRSLGGAVERMGVPRVGSHGSLAAAAILTAAIESAKVPLTGFSGFMQPVLEDSVLARRAAEGSLTIKDLLLYSAVCGTGLDTVPLPGNVSADQLAPLLMDLSALALRLDKPLTARLMPIPGKEAGDPTGFDFAFFANSRVMRLEAEALSNTLSGNEILVLPSKKMG